jgi:hypothetical protein
MHVDVEGTEYECVTVAIIQTGPQIALGFVGSNLCFQFDNLFLILKYL